MNKRGGLVISINGVITIIIAIIVLGLLIAFIKGSFWISTKKIRGQIETENEPITPDANNPITLSRQNIKTNPEATEVIKIAVFNPTANDWMIRDDLYVGFSGCGASDKICYITTGCDGTSDPDCQGEIDRNCKKDGVCLVNENYGNIIDPSDGISKKCPKGVEQELSDCGPQDGIDLLINCNNELKINSVSQPKVILAEEIQKFTSVIEVKKGVKGRYLCQIKVFGNNLDGSQIKGLQKDLTIEVI